MTDLPDDLPADDDVEQPERLALPALDSFRAVRDLVALAVDPKAVKRHLRQLHDALAATAAAQRQLESDQAAFAQYEQKTRAELAAQAANLREGQVALANAKDSREDKLAEREQRIRELEAAWRFVAEDDDVRSGFRSAEFSSLMKARAAYGFTRDSGLDDVAREMREKFPTRTVRTVSVVCADCRLRDAVDQIHQQHEAIARRTSERLPAAVRRSHPLSRPACAANVRQSAF